MTGTTLSSSYFTAVTLVDGATQNPLTITTTGEILTAGNALTGGPGVAWLVTNYGKVSGTGAHAIGVSLASGGTIVNGVSASIYGTTYGIDVHGGTSAVVNAGSIGAGNVFGAIGIMLAGSSSVTNGSTGTISGFWGLDGAQSVVNAGSIMGNTAGGFGVELGKATTLVSLTNLSTGLISGDIGVASPFASTTIVNAGTIAGTQFAVKLPGNAIPSTLIVDPGAVFFGTVAGGNANASMLELASGGTAGIISGIGSKYVGFNQIAVDSGAAWTLAGANTIGLGVTLTDAGTLTNSGLMSGPVTVAASGLLSNASSGSIAATTAVFVIAATGSVINAGQIDGQVGISLPAGGTVINQATGTIVATSSGSAPYAIHETHGTATVVNAGVISAGAFARGVDLGGGGSITNLASASIIGSVAAEAGNTSLIDAGGTLVPNPATTLVNAGTIAGFGATGIGVELWAGGTVNNLSTGTISGNCGLLTVGQAGVTVTNAGTISGSSYAVRFGGGVANRLIVDPGASFSGTVNGGVKSGSTINSTLELASGASAGTLTGLGTSFSNFAAVAVDTGATWSFAGTNAIGPGVTLTDAGTMTNTGSLSGNVTLSAGGYLLNTAAGILAGGVYGSASVQVVNAGTILHAGVAAIDVASGNATIVNGSSTGTAALLSGQFGIYLQKGNGQVTNYGTIIGYIAIAGVRIGGSGTVVNGTTADTSALISSAGEGIFLTGGGSVSNNGSILSAAGPAAIDLGAAGVLNNTGTIRGGNGVEVRSGSGTVINTGDIAGLSAAGVALQSGGTVVNGSASPGPATISGYTNGVFIGGAAGTVSNQGTILGATKAAVFLQAGGSAINGSVADTFATMNGYNYGVYVNGSGSMTNDGTVTGTVFGIFNQNGGSSSLNNGAFNDTTALISSKSQAAVEGIGTIANYGTIATGGKFGVSIAGGTLTNAGSIIGQTGIKASTATSIVNTGEILGTGTAGNYAGVRLNGTLTNAGTIIGVSGTAVSFYGFSDRLVLDPGGIFGNGAAGGTGLVVAQSAVTAHEVLELAPGTAGAAGTLTGLGTKFQNFGTIVVDAGARWALTGGNSLASGTTLTNLGSLTLSNGSFADAGTLINNGAILLDPGTLTAYSLLGSGQVTIGASGTLSLPSAVAAGETIGFSTASGLLQVANPASFQGAIGGFAAGDTIDLTSLRYVSGASASIANGVLTVDSGGTTGTLNLNGIVAGTKFSVTRDAAGTGSNVAVLCFCAGTKIATPDGEVPVECLAVGDAVLNHRGETHAITWIGIGRVRATRGRRSAATPVIIRKGALSDNVPNDDLRVTKGHSLYLDDVLIPVEFLVNHRSILWDDRAQDVSIYHVELATHGVLLANGAPAESYRDDGNRWLFGNANTGWDQPAKPPCAPVLTGGDVVDAVWRRLLDRAGPRPRVPMTDDPDLHLLVDGHRVNPSDGGGDGWVFKLPGPFVSIRIASRAGVPQELGFARDPRCLGVALRQVAVRQGTRWNVTDADDPELRQGFHDFEEQNGLRWTDGDAALPPAMFDAFGGSVELVLRLGGTTQYPL